MQKKRVKEDLRNRRIVLFQDCELIILLNWSCRDRNFTFSGGAKKRKWGKKVRKGVMDTIGVCEGTVPPK